MRFLVTGAAGFIGKALCRGLCERGHSVLGIVATPQPRSREIEWCALGRISPQTLWPPHLEGIDCVIHLAARAHRRAGAAIGDEPETAAVLYRAAAKAGVKRFIGMSSVRAMGDETPPDLPFRAGDAPSPAEGYGRTKLMSERALEKAARESGSELFILRPPLVYGPGAKGNFRALLRLLAKGLPLPFAGIENRRSLVYLENLVDLTIAAATLPKAAGGVFLVCDGEDFSTPELVRILAEGLGRPARLFPSPPFAFALGRRCPFIGPRLKPLISSLTVDDEATRAFFGWRPPVAAREGLLATARAFAQKGVSPS